MMKWVLSLMILVCWAGTTYASPMNRDPFAEPKKMSYILRTVPKPPPGMVRNMDSISSPQWSFIPEAVPKDINVVHAEEQLELR